MLGRTMKKTAMPPYQFSRTVCVAVILSLLSGCAAQQTFDEGSKLVQQDKPEQGLQKMHEASRMDPGQVEFKTKYYYARDASISGFLEQADRDIAARRYQEAGNLFSRVLVIDSNNARAKDGLNHIAIEQRHDQLISESAQLFDSGEVDKARAKLHPVLSEDPSNIDALQLQHRMDEKSAGLPVSNSLKAMYKKPVTLQFKDATLKQIFEIIAQSSGLNFIFDKDVKTDTKTSIFLKDSTIETAIYYTLMTSQLDQQVMDGNTILIYPNSSAKQKDYQELVVKSFFLTNADAKTVAATLKSVVKSRDIVIDEKLNMIIMRDSPEAIRLAEKLVALHDIAEPEVMLEVAVMEVKRTKLQDLGVQWPNNLTLTPLTPLAALQNATSVSGTTGGVTGQVTGPLVLSNLKSIPAANIAIGNPSATVNAHSTDGDANLLANPRIRTRNHEKAKIMIGDRVPNITVNTAVAATAFVSETITYVDVGLKLEIEPTVYLDNEVGIKISLEVSNIVSQLITKSGSSAYQIGTRNAASVLRLKDGETQILAGLLDDEERHTINKIPGLGDIPILGRLFGSTNDDLQKTEIILSITPHVINNIRRPNASAAEFSSGTENNLKPRPDSAAVDSDSSGDAAAVPGAKLTSGSKKFPQTGNVSVNAATIRTAAPANPVPAGGAEIVPIVNVPPADATAQTGPLKLFMEVKGGSGVLVGGTFDVQLYGQSDNAVNNLPVVVGFDPTYFQVLSVAEGDFLKQGRGQSSFTSEIDPKGQVVIHGSSTGGRGNVSGIISSIKFKALSAGGDSAIQVVSAAPTDVGGHPMNVSNTANVILQVHDSAEN